MAPPAYDVAGATWLPVPAHVPTGPAFAAELEAAAPGTAFRYGKHNCHVYVHTGERGWLAAHGASFEAALAALERSADWKSAEAVAGDVLSNWSLATMTFARRR